MIQKRDVYRVVWVQAQHPLHVFAPSRIPAESNQAPHLIKLTWPPIPTLNSLLHDATECVAPPSYTDRMWKPPAISVDQWSHAGQRRPCHPRTIRTHTIDHLQRPDLATKVGGYAYNIAEHISDCFSISRILKV